MESKKEDKVWAFGFGANLNAQHIEQKKQLKILDSCAARVSGFLFAFPLGGVQYVDPAFACAFQQKGSEIHGLAFATT